MNTPDRFDGLLDLSLRHSLKNLVARGKSPASGRVQLLVAAARQAEATRQAGAKHRWLSISFRFSRGLHGKNALPGYDNLLDTISILKSRMLVA